MASARAEAIGVYKEMQFAEETRTCLAFPNIIDFSESHTGPYELQMGGMILGLLRIFAGRVPDYESNARVAELAATPSRWSAAHVVFDEVRRRLLASSGDSLKQWQYGFEESCCQSLYNATSPDDPFDASSPFFVVPQALDLSRMVEVSLADVVAALAPK